LPGVALLVAVPPARADFEITLSETGFAPLVIHDNGAGDADSTVGSIVFSGTYADFNFNGKIKELLGGSNQSLGGPKAEITLSDGLIVNTHNDPKTLTISITQTGFNFPGIPPEILALSG